VLSDVALMRNKSTGLPRGFGFVKFRDSAVASEVLGRAHTIDGRTVDVKRAVPKDKGQQPQQQQQQQPQQKQQQQQQQHHHHHHYQQQQQQQQQQQPTPANSSRGGGVTRGSGSGTSGGGAGASGGASEGASSRSSGGGSSRSSGAKTASSARAGASATAKATSTGQTTGAVAQPPTLDSEQQSKKIFVGGLAPSVSDMEFRVYFERYGTINDAVVMFDRQTQRSRGFGFITFQNHGSVEQVFQDEPHELNGKAVEVKRAEPKDSRAPPIPSTNPKSEPAGPEVINAPRVNAWQVAQSGPVLPPAAAFTANLAPPMPAAFAGLASALAGALPTVPLPTAVPPLNPWHVPPIEPMVPLVQPPLPLEVVSPDMEGQLAAIADPTVAGGGASSPGPAAFMWPTVATIPNAQGIPPVGMPPALPTGMPPGIPPGGLPPGLPAPAAPAVALQAGAAGMGMIVAPTSQGDLAIGATPIIPYGYTFFPQAPMPSSPESPPTLMFPPHNPVGSSGRGEDKCEQQPRDTKK